MAAAHIIRQHRPNLMLFHLLNLDSTQHRYGPRTPAAMAAMALLDTQVATILQAVHDAGIGRVPRCSSCRTMASKTVKCEYSGRTRFSRRKAC